MTKPKPKPLPRPTQPNRQDGTPRRRPVSHPGPKPPKPKR